MSTIAIPGVTQPGTLQWLNPDALYRRLIRVRGSAMAATARKHCQFGNLGRNALRGPDFLWSDFYLTKWFPLTEQCEAAV